MSLRRNIELKCRCADLYVARKAVLSLDPTNGGVQQQIDTYFQVPHGRLKLREIVGIKSELIWYDRSDEAETRKSDYRLVPVPNPGELKAALTSAMGLRGEVRKQRQVLLWHNVRIHLDDVEALGTFVEFEAVMSEGEDEATGHARLAELARVMSIKPEDYLKHSYSDLLGI